MVGLARPLRTTGSSPTLALLLVTEGMLTNYLDDDPLLSGFVATVRARRVSRTNRFHTDLGLALVTQAWRARDNLRVVVMSATMDPAPVRAYLE
jgi:ATP-dependent helicase HrpB